AGSATNLPDGQVEVDAQGLPADVDALVDLLTGPTASGRPGRVTGHLTQRRDPDPAITGFETR
ncbi:MAG: acylphosphatase, partial [Propionibacteriaceae bacterium]|nr:acylphosphatase [Propionibacteriaceae bacterium]